MTDGQASALEEIREVEAFADGALEILSIAERDGVLLLDCSISTRSFSRAPGGLRLRSRERITISVPVGFPFRPPQVDVPHCRFAGFPHVQWKRHLCLYQAQNAEWDASDGMFGFLGRLEEWLRQAALNQLDPVGAPLHPPVAYVTGNRMVVPKVNAPATHGQPWYGLAGLRSVSDRRTELNCWSAILAAPPPSPVGAVVLLPAPMPFEFPAMVSDLLNELEERGVPRRHFFLTLKLAVAQDPKDSPLYVVIGTPMRGIQGTDDLKQHLSVWYVCPVLANGLRLSLSQHSTDDRLREIGVEVERIIMDWAAIAPVDWCRLTEARPEIVSRRDHDSTLSWFAGRTVLLWGCGALGSAVAEYLTRVGVAKLFLHDRGIVTPGVLLRQLYEDADITELKVEALARRLRRIRDDLDVETRSSDLLTALPADDLFEGVDLVIDTTASRALLKKLEFLWGQPNGFRASIASMVVGPRAERGLVVLSRPRHSGAVADVARLAKLAACSDRRLHHFVDEFWPDASDARLLFQPEPGCSDPTFVGSVADVAVLAGTMLNHVAQDLRAGDPPATAHFITQPHLLRRRPENLSYASFAWPSDRVTLDNHAGYQVRIAHRAWQSIMTNVQRSVRWRGRRVETGGLLFGERDDAARVVWVSDATGPPPDSRASRRGFLCGIVGTAALNNEMRTTTRGAVRYIGMWHTHPDSPPLPSDIDLEGMAQLLTCTAPPLRRALLLIVGHTPQDPTPGAYLFSRGDFSNSPMAGRFRSLYVWWACLLHPIQWLRTWHSTRALRAKRQ